MVRGIASDPSKRMQLSEVLSAAYDDGFGFYTYAFAFWSFLYHQRQDIMMQLIDLVMSDNVAGYDQLIQQLKNDVALNNSFQNYMTELVNNLDQYNDPLTGSQYLEEINTYDMGDVISEIDRLAGLENEYYETYQSKGYSLFKITGTYTGGAYSTETADWGITGSFADKTIESLSDYNWNGYQTINCYFTDYSITSTGNYRYKMVFTGKITSDKNLAPVAVINGPYTGIYNTPVQFNSTGSYDPDGTISAYYWDFGDGSSSTGASPSHIYKSGGQYNITLEITDNKGKKKKVSLLFG